MKASALLFFLILCGFFTFSQTLDLRGPTEMGRCETATFSVAFTANPTQTASALVFTVARPNLGFAYVEGSAVIVFPEGTEIQANPIKQNLDLTWDINGILPEAYELPPGETLTVEFVLSTGCSTVSGTLYARVDYEEDGVSDYLTDSQPVQILPGAVLIYKEPSVFEAAVGDIVTWTITVENTGLGPIYNVVVTDVLGSGLSYAGSNPQGNVNGQEVVWEVPQLLAGEKAQFTLSAQVTACTGLDNKADARFGCEEEVCYDTAVQGGTATASIRLKLGQPLLDFSAPTIIVPYCDPLGGFVKMPIKNTGDGNARNIQICVNYAPFSVLSVVAPATYENGCFHIPDLGPGEYFELQFYVGYQGDWCSVPTETTVFYQAIYKNDCGEEFRPPVLFGTVSVDYGQAGRPSLSVSLTGGGEVHICTDVTLNLSVTFGGIRNCGGGQPSTIHVVGEVPRGFVVKDAGGGTWNPDNDGTGGTITWNVDPDLGLSTQVVLGVPGATRCGTIASFVVTAEAYDCCGCVLRGVDSVEFAIECKDLVSSVRIADPQIQETCGQIRYTNTYYFADGSALDNVEFTELTFTEEAAQNQRYVSGTLEIRVDNVPVNPVAVNDNTPGGPLVIQGINYSGSVRGHTLNIAYTLELADSGCTCWIFYTWATLNLGPDCRTGNECQEYCTKQDVIQITSTPPRMRVYVTGLPTFVDPCGTYDVTVTLVKDSDFDPHDVFLRLENTNYYIVDLQSIQISGVQPQSVSPQEYSGYYEWTYSEAFVGQDPGAQSVLTFNVRKRCGPGVALSATALYKDLCGAQCSASGSATPAFLRSPNLFVYKTPEVIYATQNQLTWTIYVVNSGSGYAYEVWVDDEMGSGLQYVSSTVLPSTDVMTYPNQDHLGNTINGVSWHIAAMAPGEQRVITLVTRMVGCSELWNEVTVGLGCGGEDCLPPVKDFSQVLVPSTQLAATSSTASPIMTCTKQPALIRIRNTGDPAVYTMVVQETLPPGLEYVADSTRWRKGMGPWSSGADPAITGNIWTGYTLEWTVNKVPGLSELRSRETLEIEFQFRALCNFEGGNFEVDVDYVNVCGEPGSLPVGTFRVEARRPSGLDIEVTQVSPPEGNPLDCGSQVTWVIDVTNTGEIAIPYVVVDVDLGDSFEYVSSTGGIDGGYCYEGLIYWVIQNLDPSEEIQLTLTAKVVSCEGFIVQFEAYGGCGVDQDGKSSTLEYDCIFDGVYDFIEIYPDIAPLIELELTVDPVPSCGTGLVTIMLKNSSTATAKDIDLVVNLPDGLSYISGSTQIDCGQGFSIGPDPQEFDGELYWYGLCTEIPPGDTARLRFAVQANCYVTAGYLKAIASYWDCCFLGSGETILPPQSVQPTLPKLTLTETPKVVALDCHNPNDTVTWTITVTNTGQAQADWVRVEDTLGGNLVYVDSDPPATAMGGKTYAWEFGPLTPDESKLLQITAYLTRPQEDCSSTLRTNTVRATWGCGQPDGDPRTQEGCASGIFVQDTATVTIPDLYLAPSDIEPVLTCQADGIYQGKVRVTVRNQGDAPVNEDFQIMITENQTGWTRTGYFKENFGGTLPINPNSTRTIWIDGWPVSCSVCTYQFTVSLDTADAVCECREGNNQNSRTWTITLPDVTVRSQNLTLKCARDGQVLISGTVTLGNEGCGSALTANVPMRFVLYDQAGCTGNILHSWTETFTGVNISAKGEQTFTVSHTFPINLCGIPECTVSLLIEADYTGSICECDGTNNTLCVELPVNIPDLTVRDEDLQLSCAGDGQVRIAGTVTLGNEGCGNNLTANVPMRFVLYEGPSCFGKVLHEWTETLTGVNIPAKGEQTFTMSHAFPIDLCSQASGCTVSLLLEADYSASICECNGENNTRCVAFPFAIPDLRITSVVPEVGNACEPGVVRVNVENVGCGLSPAGRCRPNHRGRDRRDSPPRPLPWRNRDSDCHPKPGSPLRVLHDHGHGRSRRGAVRM